jgi:hypothetical protein
MIKGMQWLRAATFSSCLTLLAAACGSSSGGSVTLPPSATCTSDAGVAAQANSVDAVGENLDTTCGAVIGDLPWKMGATGSPCAQPIDCSPACCPCSNGTYRVLATVCDHGTCAAPAAVCCIVLGTPLKACGS